MPSKLGYEVDLFEAVNNYASACGGDPSRFVYGNTHRQKAVSKINQTIELILGREKIALIGFIASEMDRLRVLHKDKGVQVNLRCCDLSDEEILGRNRPFYEFRLDKIEVDDIVKEKTNVRSQDGG